MDNPVKRLSRLLPVVLLLAVTGCTTMPDAQTHHSGFLDDYARMSKDPQWPKSEVWVKPGLALSQSYQKRVYIEPPRLYSSDADLKRNPAETRAMLKYLNQAMMHQFLTAGYEVTRHPEPNTLMLRTAITGSERTPRDLSIPEYLPIGFIIGGAMHLTGTRDESVRIFFEGEMRDAKSRELLAQSVSATTGKNISPSAVTKVEDTYPALDAWAKQLRERADQAFAKPASSH